MKWMRVLALILAAALCAGCTPGGGGAATAPPQTVSSTDSMPPQTIPAPTQPELPTQPPAPTEPPTERFLFSFAGDCTMGDNFDAEKDFGTFCKVVGDRYDYPFANVRHIFENDELTFVNLECALTDSEPTEEEMETLKDNLFRFRGPQAYAKILTAGSVEFASCANNHSLDYGWQGLKDTLSALEAENIFCASRDQSCLITTPAGLKVGVVAIFFAFTETFLREKIQSLRDQGAQIVVVSIHWGDEGTYFPNDKQQSLGHQAVDAGADIVYGHHSHTLQPIEYYHGGVIYYSLGNFTFGGNRYPKDMDTAIIQQEILREADGTVRLGQTYIIPCSVSSIEIRNDFCPTPYGQEDPGYDRVFSKLEGSYTGEDLDIPYQTKTTSGTTETE